MYDAGSSRIKVLCDNLQGWDKEGGRREVQKGGGICTPMTDLC